jgi:hypothetical protein
MEGLDLSKFVTDGGIIATILGIMVGVQFILYGVATGLTKIAVYTENKWDNKIAAILSQAAWFLGVFLGKFGYSIPKPVLEEAVHQGADKALKKELQLESETKAG